MKLEIDTETNALTVHDGGKPRRLPLYSKEGFELLSDLWVKVGWNERYGYTFSWFGRPVIQLPEDMVRVQEAIWTLKPDLVIETGVAHGGSLIFYASLFQAIGRGRVVGIDIEIRPHNRSAIEGHPLSPRIALIEGSSTDAKTVSAARAHIKAGEIVLVILDSNHLYDHVMAELEAYAGMVSPGSYIVATDGIMSELADVPRGEKSWVHDNPTRAAADFAAKHPEFRLEQPAWPFNESKLDRTPTWWPGAWLRRVG
jgi:cephalosporin hydroxylase